MHRSTTLRHPCRRSTTEQQGSCPKFGLSGCGRCIQPLFPHTAPDFFAICQGGTTHSFFRVVTTERRTPIGPLPAPSASARQRGSSPPAPSTNRRLIVLAAQASAPRYRSPEWPHG